MNTAVGASILLLLAVIYIPGINSSGISFPDSVHVLNLVSSQNGEQMPGWIELHEAVQGNNPNTTMVITEGSHGLTSDNPEALLEEIHNWIKQSEKCI